MQELDLTWVNSFLDDLLAHWRQESVTANGIFYPYLDRRWQRRDGSQATLVSQCRLIYNFARAFERSRDNAYAEAARSGVGALVTHFRDTAVDDADGTGWHWACDFNGQVRDDTWDAYGQAFVVLALATAARVLQDDHYCDLALRTWRFMQRRFGDRHGGLIWHVGRDGRPRDERRSQNPVMHTFEALLALAPLDDGGAVRRDAAHVWRFIRSRVASGTGCLPEWYDADWIPLYEGDRAGADIGHAFEWAFLCSEAHALELEDELVEDQPAGDLLEAGRDFLSFGMSHGYDHESGGIYSAVSLDGQLRDTGKGWWQQCEAIRALHRYVVRHGAHELQGPLSQSLDFVRRHYIDREYGGWYQNPPGMGGQASLDKGDAYKLDYHVVNLCLELLSV